MSRITCRSVMPDRSFPPSPWLTLRKCISRETSFEYTTPIICSGPRSWSNTGALAGQPVAGQLAAAVKAEVIQVIGKTVTLYRHNPKIERKPGAAHPWEV